jgi:hypothetical protein
VSHQPERNEKDCLNCGTMVSGRYCHVCGQENVETKESFFSLLKHFVYDIIHFDSKFFDTLKYILFRPGYIAKQYVEGKRARFLHPIRMYLFTSAFFFLVLFWLQTPKAGYINRGSLNDTLSKEERVDALSDLQEELKEKPGDSILLQKISLLKDTTQILTTSAIAALDTNSKIEFGNTRVASLQQYDSLQNAVPVSQRDGWMKKRMIRKMLEVKAKYSGRLEEALSHFVDLFLHKLSYLLFISLPFFALILKLLYARRKNFYYSDHAVFTLYHYIFSFILLLIVLLLGKLSDWTHVQLFQKLIPLLLLLWLVYLCIALKNFYGQGWGKTFSKFLLLNLLGIIVLLLLFTVFVFFTLFQL